MAEAENLPQEKTKKSFNFDFYVVLVSAALVLLILGSMSVQAGPLGYNGEWGYDQSKEEGYDEFYNQTLFMIFNRQVTHAFSYNGDVRYTANWKEQTEKKEVWSPSLNMYLVNDLYTLQFSGTSTETNVENAPKTSDRHWQGAWASNWRKKYMPEFYFNYGQRYELDDQRPRSRDTVTDNGSGRVDWNVEKVRLGYNYDWYERDDKVGLIDNKNNSHFAHLDYHDSFLANRLSANLSQKFTKTDTEITTLSPQTQFVEIPLLNVETDIDDTPANNADIAPLTINPGMFDNDLSTVALTINSGDKMNINSNPNISSASIFTRVDKIYLYTDIDITETVANQFTWLIYTNQNPAITPTWSQVLPLSSYIVTYNPTEQRIEFDFSPIGGITAPHIKLFAETTPAIAINFTEIAMLFGISPSSKIESGTDSYKTDFGLNYKVTPTVLFDYVFSYEARQNTTGNDRDLDSHTGRLSWNPSKVFSSSFRSSFSRQKEKERPDTSSNIYAVDATYSPFDTLDLNFGIDHTDAFQDGNKFVVNDNFNLNINGQLFPDLGSSLDLNYNTSEQKTIGLESDVFDTRLIITSRLTPQLTTSLTGKYNKTDSIIVTETERLELSSNWRVSDMLLLNLTGQQQWQSGNQDIKALTTRMVMALTRKMQVDLNYNLTDTLKTNQNLLANFNWNISRLLSLSVDGAYQINSEVETWRITTRLKANIGFN